MLAVMVRVGVCVRVGVLVRVIVRVLELVAVGRSGPTIPSRTTYSCDTSARSLASFPEFVWIRLPAPRAWPLT